jgi:hypothetical protein
MKTNLANQYYTQTAFAPETGGIGPRLSARTPETGGIGPRLSAHTPETGGIGPR